MAKNDFKKIKIFGYSFTAANSSGLPQFEAKNHRNKKVQATLI